MPQPPKALETCDDRNLTSHTYKEALAQELVESECLCITQQCMTY